MKERMLASGNMTSKIKLWGLDDYKCIKAIIASPNKDSLCEFELKVIPCNGKECLLSVGSDNTMKIWDLQSMSLIKL